MLRCYASRSVCAFYSLLLSWLLIWANCSFGRNFTRSFSSSRMLMSTPFLTKMLADVCIDAPPMTWLPWLSCGALKPRLFPI